MRRPIIFFAALLTSLTITAADDDNPNWALDGKCGDPTQDSFARGIVKGMKSSLNRADEAVRQMTAAQGNTDHLAHRIFKIIFGGNEHDEYDAKFGRILTRYKAITTFKRDPSPYNTLDPRWTAQRTKRDVEFWCSADDNRYEIRFHQQTGQQHWWNKNTNYWDAATHDTVVDVVQGRHVWAAVTVRFEDEDRNPNGVLTGVREWGIHNTINMNPAPMNVWKGLGWPDAVDRDFIGRVRDPFRRGDIENALQNFRPNGPTHIIDLLRNTDHLIFHELTHTAAAGFPRAVDEPLNNCYGWDCVVAAKNENNADSLAALAQCLQLHTIGFSCQEDGSLLPITPI